VPDTVAPESVKYLQLRIVPFMDGGQTATVYTASLDNVVLIQTPVR
jgi:hypothetical protein